MFLRFALLVFASSVVCAPTAHADVWIVGGPGATHPSVQAAVDAAQPGDVVLVRASFHETVTIGHGVAVVADAPGSITWTGSVRVQDVPAGQTVLISGFGMALTSTAVLSGNAGAIRIQECGLLPLPIPFQPPLIAMTSTGNGDLALLRSSVSGGSAQPSPPGVGVTGAIGFISDHSRVTIQDSTVSGGRGLNGVFFGSGFTSGGPGGDAAHFAGGALVLQSSAVRGGSGGNGGASGTASAGGPGGQGIVLSDSAIARAVGGSTLGGSGGAGVPNGQDGAAVIAGSGTWTEFPDVDRAFTAPRIVREGEPLGMSFSGAPLEQALMARSAGAARLESSSFHGVVLVSPPFRRLMIGTLDPLGQLGLSMTTPDLPPGATNDFIHLQSMFVDALGSVSVGCTSIVVRLDASY